MTRSIAAILLVLPLAAGCGEKDKPPAPPTVSAAKPIVREIEEWDEYTGRLEAVDSVEIRARVSGYLTSISFKDGQIVNKGDLLFIIDPRPFEVAAADADARLDQTKSQVEYTAREVERAAELRKRDNIPTSTYDDRLRAAHEAKASEAQAEAAVRAAQLNLEFTQVRAPIAGRVSRHAVSIGTLVSGGAADATLLTTIVSLDPIHFYFDADEAAYNKYTQLSISGSRPSSRDVANPVRLSVADETDFSHEGRMDFVDNRIDRATGTMRGRALFPNPQINGQYLFTPGQFGRIRLLGSGKYKAILLPDQAIGADQSRRVVFVVAGDGTVTARGVRLGPLNNGLRIVRDGVGPDDLVVINGLQRIRPGQKVTAQTVDLAAMKLETAAAPAVTP